MFHTLTNVQDGAAVPLLQPTDNQNGNLRVGLRSINYTVGWFDVGPQEAFSWRPSAKTEIMGTIPFPPGLYSFPRLINLFSEIGINLGIKVANAPSAPLYPELSAEPASVFRLQKISEIKAFLRTEVKNSERLHKKYRRAVNALEATCGALGGICIATGAVGAALLASGIGFVAGLVLEGITGAAGLLDVAGVAVSCHYLTKAAKHEVVRVIAIAKLNTVHRHISKAV